MAYSTSKRLTYRGRFDDDLPPSSNTGRSAPPTESHILLLTIYNAQYPITVDVIHQVTNRHGKVLRIVIFRKTGVQAMVEFATVAEARETKRHINGADIYSGCCSLKVEYAKQTRLKVVRNCLDSWDYENPGLMDGSEAGRPAAASLLGKFEGELVKRADAAFLSPNNLAAAAVAPTPVLSALAMLAASRQPPTGAIGYPEPSDRQSGSPVVMVYNLNMTHANCDR